MTRAKSHHIGAWLVVIVGIILAYHYRAQISAWLTSVNALAATPATTTTPPATAQSTSSASDLPNLPDPTTPLLSGINLMPPVITVFPRPVISGDVQRDLDAIDRAAGVPTTAEAAAQFGWETANPFVVTPARPAPGRYVGRSSSFGSQSAFDALDSLVSRIM